MTAQASFDTLSVEVVYDGWSQVRREVVRAPDGTTLQREIVAHRSAVAIVPVTASGEVLLLRQYRQPVRDHVLEIPAGLMDVAGEAPHETAQRELAEEIGHGADDLRYLTTFHNSAGWTTERTHVYLATGLHPVALPDGFELSGEEADMQVVSMPLADAVEGVHRGEIVDAKTIVGLLLAVPLVGAGS